MVPYQVLLLRVRVDLEVIGMKVYFVFSKATELKLHQDDNEFTWNLRSSANIAPEEIMILYLILKLNVIFIMSVHLELYTYTNVCICPRIFW